MRDEHVPKLITTPTPALPALEFRSFAQLQNTVADPPWLWDGFLAKGSLTMLSGQPFAGKSMLVGGLLRAIESGERFLGRETTKASAVIVTEEDEATFRLRASSLALFDLRSEYLTRNNGSLNLDWERLIEQATARALDTGHSLLVVDTFPGLAGLDAEQENDAGAVGSKLRALQKAAGLGLGVLFLHHMNKFGQPRGSKAFNGVVDVSARLQRTGNRITLTTDSRYPTTPRTLTGQLNTRKQPWVFVAVSQPGKEARDVTHTVSKQLLDAVAAAGTTGITYEELGALPGLSKDMAKRRLPKLRGKAVAAYGNGTKGDPLRWYVIDAVQKGA